MPSLSVETTSQFTELRVLDPMLREVATGIGRLHVTLPRGIYRVQGRLPGAYEQRLVPVGLDEVTSISMSLAAESLAPLPGAPSAHPAHIELAVAESRHPHVTLAETAASLFLFVRGGGEPHGHPPQLTLQTLEGEVLARLSESGVFDPTSGAAALTVALPSGTHALVADAPGLGRRGQAVFVQEGWQTQLFIPWDAAGPDPARALVVMVPRGHGFDPEATNYLEVQAALDGLAHGRVVLSELAKQQIVHGDFDNPLLALAGAYGYLRDGRMPLGRLDAATRKLLQLLPRSPDAHLLRRIHLAHVSTRAFDYNAGAWTQFHAPPMFAVGTDMLLGRAAGDAALVPAHSPLAAIASSRTVGSVWSRWSLTLDGAEQVRRLAPAAFDARHPGGSAQTPDGANAMLDELRELLANLPAIPATTVVLEHDRIAATVSRTPGASPSTTRVVVSVTTRSATGIDQSAARRLLIGLPIVLTTAGATAHLARLSEDGTAAYGEVLAEEPLRLDVPITRPILGTIAVQAPPLELKPAAGTQHRQERQQLFIEPGRFRLEILRMSTGEFAITGHSPRREDDGTFILLLARPRGVQREPDPLVIPLSWSSTQESFGSLRLGFRGAGAEIFASPQLLRDTVGIDVAVLRRCLRLAADELTRRRLSQAIGLE